MSKRAPSAAPGSSTYYSIRFAPEACRQDLFKLSRVIQHLVVIPRECSDPAVALKKLAWWREELDKGFEGASSHPASVALGEISRRRLVRRRKFDDLLAGVEQEVVNDEIRSREQFIRYCTHAGASVAELLTAVADGNTKQVETSSALGRFSRQIEVIRNLGRDLREGRMLLPTEPFLSRGLDTSRLLADEQRDEAKAVLRELASEFRKQYAASVAAIPRGDQTPLGPAFSLSAISSALLDEIERDDFDVLSSRTSLAPARKLWIAWRHHRKIRCLH